MVEIVSGPRFGKRGRVTALHTDGKVEVDLADDEGLLRGFRYWFSADEVLTGASRVARAKPAARTRREMRIEVRPVCLHVSIADLCQECHPSRRRP